MAEAKKVLVDIEINSEDIKKANEAMASSAKSAATLTLELNKLKEEQKKNNAEAKSGAISATELAARQAGLKLKMTETSKALSASNKDYANNKIVVDAAKGSNEQLRARLALQTKEYNGLSKSQRENSKEGQRMQATIKNISDKLKENEKAVGDNRRNVGNYSDALKGAAGSINIMGVNIGSLITKLTTAKEALVAQRAAQQASTAATGVGTGALKLFKVALASTGIGILIIALGSLVAFFTSTKEGVELLEQGMAALRATIDVLVDRASNLVSVFTLLKDGEFAKAGDAIAESFSGIGDEMAKDAQAAILLEKEMQSLVNAERDLLVETSKRKAEVAALQLIAEDETNTMKERAEAIAKANAIQIKTMNAELELQRERVRITREQNALGKDLTADKEKLAQEEAKLGNIEAASIKKLRTLKAKENSIRNQERALQVKNANAIRKLIDDQIKAEEKAAEANAKIREEFRISQLTDIEKRKEDALNKATELRNAGEEEKAITAFLSQELIEIHRAEQDVILNDRLQAFEDEATAARTKAEIEIQDERIRAATILQINSELAEAKQQTLDLEVMGYTASTEAMGFVDEERNAQLLQQKAEVDAEILEIDREKTEALKANNREVADSQAQMQQEGIAAAQGGLGAVGDIIGGFAQQIQNNIKNIEEQAKAAGKTDAEISKLTKKARKEAHGLQVAAAIVQTLQAGIAAYQSGAAVPVVGVALGPIMAAAALAFGFANVSKMKQQKFAKGGVLQGASHAEGGIQMYGNGQHYGEAEDGEIVLTKGVNADPNLRAKASRLNVLGGGVPLVGSNYMADGGIVSPTFAARQTQQTASLTRRDLSEVIGQMPAPIVTVSDINRVQGQVATVSQSADL